MQNNSSTNVTKFVLKAITSLAQANVDLLVWKTPISFVCMQIKNYT
jgi:hypothetical protein